MMDHRAHGLEASSVVMSRWLRGVSSSLHQNRPKPRDSQIAEDMEVGKGQSVGKVSIRSVGNLLEIATDGFTLKNFQIHKWEKRLQIPI